MLVLDPSKRYTISMIKKHQWMQQDGGPPKQAPPSPVIGQNAKMGEYNEQILRLMQGMKIDRNKTVEVGHFFLICRKKSASPICKWLCLSNLWTHLALD